MCYCGWPRAIHLVTSSYECPLISGEILQLADLLRGSQIFGSLDVRETAEGASDHKEENKKTR